MLNFLSRPMVRLIDRYLPDPFVFVLVLTLIAGLAARLAARVTVIRSLKSVM